MNRQIIIDETKWCNYCKQYKVFDDFYSSKRKYGLRDYCKKCQSIQWKKTYVKAIKFEKNMRTCCKCKEELSLEQFGKCKSQPQGIGYVCKKCMSLYYKENKHLYWVKWIKKQYNLEEFQYWEMFNKQNGRCDICECLPKKNKKLCIDHCHDTGKVRGLLCDECNWVIGNFKNDIKIMLSAKCYLKNNPTIILNEIPFFPDAPINKNRIRKLKEVNCSVEQYQKDYIKCSGNCMICHSNDYGILHIDHNHITGQYRGLLCQMCNPAIGKIKEDEQLLEKMIAYMS